MQSAYISKLSANVYSHQNLVRQLCNGINVMLLILQRVLSATQIRVNMEAIARMMDCIDAVAQMIILEILAKVSVIAVMYTYKIYFHNLLYSVSVTLYNVIP